VFVEESFAVRPNRKIFTFLRKKLLRLIDYGLFAEETFADLGKKRKNRKTSANTFFP